MRLLFDENLAPRLVRDLADLFPGSAHVREVGLASADDAAVRDLAAAQGFTIASKAVLEFGADNNASFLALA